MSNDWAYNLLVGGRTVSEKEHKVSRRQFLTYTLTGVGGFMAAGVLMPMARFALDPALKASAESDMHYVCDLDDLTEEPQRFVFSYDQVDAWYESEVQHEAYIFRQGDDVIALSSSCTHLGCTVAYQEDQGEFACPCHGGRFEKSGKNVPNLPPQRPLDRYEVLVEDGRVSVGQVNQQT